ncbi:MAG: TatD family hydrolase [Candidatus Aenigmarchaeota archaeon]|nr:TatD family hydrolase [Candidatus Aenigmarchaeota archaeon]
MIDIHAHLCFPEFAEDREQVVAQARREVQGILVSSCTLAEGECALALARRHPGFLFPSLGCHPVQGDHPQEIASLIARHAGQVVAIGEVGLDHHWVKDPLQQRNQEAMFGQFIALAERLRKPLVIHSWDAEQRCFQLVRDREVQAAFHCYTGPPDLAEEIAARGFFVSISTNVLFSKRLRKTAARIPLDRLLLETDSPFLDPDRARRRNTPGNIRLSARKVAELRGVSEADILDAAAKNAKRLFSLQLMR